MSSTESEFTAACDFRTSIIYILCQSSMKLIYHKMRLPHYLLTIMVPSWWPMLNNPHVEHTSYGHQTLCFAWLGWKGSCHYATEKYYWQLFWFHDKISRTSITLSTYSLYFGKDHSIIYICIQITEIPIADYKYFICSSEHGGGVIPM